MKGNKNIALSVGVGALAFVASAMVYASGGNAECGCRGHRGASLMEDATFEAANTSKGVIVTVTSEKPEVVKTIQARFANFGKQRGWCGHAEGSAECKKAHKSDASCGNAECGCRGHRGASLMEDATFEAATTSKGVIVTVTSKKPEVVKTIQARFANFGKQRGWCGRAEGFAECKKAHKSGRCCWHKPGAE